MTKEEIIRELGQIRMKLYEAGIKQKELAAAVIREDGNKGISLPGLNNLLRGTLRSVSPEKFERIQKAANELLKSKEKK